MKKILFILIAALPFMMSCKMESSDNGDLDGFWHLVQVDTLVNSKQTDLSQQKVFWSFQKDLMQLRGSINQEPLQEFYVRFSMRGDYLSLTNLHLKDREKDDPLVDETTMPLIYPYGIHASEETFSVIKLDNDELILQNGELRLKFSKM